MGLFDFFQRARERRAASRIKKRFASYVDPAVIDEILANPQALSVSARETRIEFLLAIVTDDDASQLPAQRRKAAAVLEGEGALLEGVMGSLFFATFKSFAEQNLPEPSVRRARAILQLRNDLGHSIRIVHGAADGIVGDIIDENHGQFGSWFPHFSEALNVLLSLAPGEARDVTRIVESEDAGERKGRDEDEDEDED